MEKISRKNIAILILAAGSSSRLGRPKQLLEIDGKTFLQKAIESALYISKNVIVVLGANEKLIRPTISNLPVEIVLNKNWTEGMSSSIRAGMTFLKEENLDGVLIMLTDQPFVDVLFLEKMVSTFEKSVQPIVASGYGGKVGVPAIFDKIFFQKLKKLEGQKGAKSLIMNNLDQIKQIVFEKGIIDIDTEEDWENFKK